MKQEKLNTLIDKLNDGRISSSERQELMDYYNDFQLSNTWREEFMGEKDVVKKRIFEKVTQRKKLTFTKVGKTIPIYYKIAACVLFVSVSLSVYLLLPESEELTVVNSAKEQKEVVLPDGSRVTMNVNSSLSYSSLMNTGNRQVSFSGEGFFEVKADSLHPFIVSTPEVKIRVLGTAFNLKAYKEDPTVEASLIHGKIEVLKAEDNKLLSVLAPHKKFVLEKSAKNALSTKGTAKQMDVKPIDFIGDASDAIPVDVAWKDGKFAFVSTPLSDIVREMSRKYGVEMKIDNAEIGSYRYSASFEKENVEEILRALTLVKSFSYRKEGEQIVIY